MKKNLVFFALFILFLSCAPASKIAFYKGSGFDNPGANSYCWKQEGPVTSAEARLVQKLTDSILQLKGFVLKDSAEADIQLHYHFIVSEKPELLAGPDEYRYDEYWDDKKVKLTLFSKGTLVIDMMELKKGLIWWRGWATDVISDKKKDKDKAIREAVREIFKTFKPL